MRLESYVCLGGTELVNGSRTTAYGAHKLFLPCPCPALEADETYSDPATDEAPWYDADHPESVNFLGILASDITLSVPYGRSTTPMGAGGQSVGQELLRGGLVEVQGWMVATDPQAMWWGERWLTEALRGSCGGCADDDLILLPYCRDTEDEVPFTDDFRTMVGAATVAGPLWSPITADDCFVIQSVQFQIATSKPWLLTDAYECMNHDFTPEYAGEEVSCMATTSAWPGDAAMVVTVTALTDATDIVVTNRVSFDGTCDDLQGMPCWSMRLPAIEAGGVFVFDGAREQVRYTDPSRKVAMQGVHLLDFSGPITWPGVGPCTDLCSVVSVGSGEVNVTIEVLNREM